MRTIGNKNAYGQSYNLCQDGEVTYESFFGMLKKVAQPETVQALQEISITVDSAVAQQVPVPFPATEEETAIGEEVRITKVGGEGELRCRLLDMGLIPKTTVKVQKVAPMGDPIEIHLRGYELTIRKEDAGKIEVELL